MFRRLAIVFLIALQISCIPFLSNNLDPNTDLSNLLLLYRIFNRRAIAYTPNALVSYTNLSSAQTVIAKPDDPELKRCGTTSRLPEGVSLADNGTLSYTGNPSRTVNPISMDIVCLDSGNQYTTSAVDFEVRGYDWIRNLSTGGFNSEGRDVYIGSDSEIYFLATTVNNGSNLAEDFGQNIIKNSSPTPGTSVSPFMLKLDSNGNLIRTRVLGGVPAQEELKITADSNQNIYLTSKLGPPPTVLTVNSDPEFGGSPVTKTPISTNGDFLLSQIKSDGSFGYALTVSATGLSTATSICYNPKTNTIQANGFANGTSQDLGLDFGVSDTTNSPLGFQLEFSPEKNYIRSRKFLGSTHRATSIDCKPDGSYTLAIQQVSNSLDYRTTFDGITDTKTAPSASGGVGLISIDSNGNYLFTKFFRHPTALSTSTGVGRDSGGNYYILFYSNGANYDLRFAIDGISEIKPSIGSGIQTSFLVKLNPDGSYAWGKMIGSNVNLILNSIAIHPKRKSIFLLGNFVGTSVNFFNDFGRNIPLSSISNQNPLLIEVNSEDASLTNARLLTLPSNVTTLDSMKMDSFGNLYLTGQFRANTNFQYGTDGGVISKTYNYGAALRQALFVKLRP
jgi:hypothetical protein